MAGNRRRENLADRLAFGSAMDEAVLHPTLHITRHSLFRQCFQISEDQNSGSRRSGIRIGEKFDHPKPYEVEPVVGIVVEPERGAGELIAEVPRAAPQSSRSWRKL